MSSGTAREHVRVARALTRIAAAATEADLAELAGPMTANQLERFARAHRRVSSADDAAARVRRRLAWRVEEDGSLSGTFRLPPWQGAVLLTALRAAAGDLEHPHPSDPEHPDPAGWHDRTAGRTALWAVRLCGWARR